VIVPSSLEKSTRHVSSSSARSVGIATFALSPTTISRKSAGIGRASVLSWKPRR
jgi:hypothetical protein